MTCEAFRMRGVGRVEDGLAAGQHDRGVAEVDDRRRQQGELRVAMVVVVPREEDVAEGAGICDGPEGVGEFPAGTSASETGWTVVRHVRATVGLGDADVRQQEGHRLRTHQAPAVRVQGELAGRNRVSGDRLGDQGLRQTGAFPMRDHPDRTVSPWLTRWSR